MPGYYLDAENAPRLWRERVMQGVAYSTALRYGGMSPTRLTAGDAKHFTLSPDSDRFDHGSTII